MSKKIRKKILSVAQAEIGQTEVPPGTNKNKYGKWYGLDGYAWCAMFVSWVYDKSDAPLGHVDDAKGFRYCPSAYLFWKKNGSLTTTPKTGDIVLFDWEGDGRSDHTGIFVQDNGDGKTFKSIEGNTSLSNNSNGGEVMERTRYYASVMAFVSPGALKGKTDKKNKALFVAGDQGSGVASLQKKLYALGYKITVDGEFGPETLGIVKQFQTDHGMKPTGNVTDSMIGAMDEMLHHLDISKKHLTTGSFLNPGSTGMAVRLLQERLNALGTKPKLAVDGVYGLQTKTAVASFQKSNGLETDGIAGPRTLKKLKLVV